MKRASTSAVARRSRRPRRRGYAASKWVAEQLVFRARDAGLQSTVYRLGLVGGDAQTGALPLKDYSLTQALRLRLALGMVPETSLHFLPSDFVARFIADNALDERWEGAVFHVDADRFEPEKTAALVLGAHRARAGGLGRAVAGRRARVGQVPGRL